MNYLLAQAAAGMEPMAQTLAATEPTPTAAQTPPADIRELTVWVAGVLIVFAITLAIWAMTKARTPLAGDHH